ncbi:MAG: S8 family serine peptidase [Paludibacteraceae bacterium]|nr:S8 family serine peptidase [Paludibacteraceae bacterium]
MRALLILLNVFFVSFADKPLDATPALSERAIEQREKWNIPTDQLDYPVSHVYLDSLRAKGAKIFHTSRWMNGATVEMSDSLATVAGSWDFVEQIETIRDESSPRPFWTPERRLIAQTQTIQALPAINQASEQLQLYNLLPLHQAGFEGQGIVMAVCDGGFYNANTLDCFRQEELELGHFDFTDDLDDFYGNTGTHGTECLSAISGITDGYQGAATKAQYYLMRSEENDTESPKEMYNLIAALETADSLGVNIFSVSLGYFVFDNSDWDFTYKDLNGMTACVSRAATIAARKGMLVCAAAGNEGQDTWHYIDIPADADSILSVGAVGTDSVIAAFSSYGPASDGRVKPEVCAVGARSVLISPQGTIIRSNGTSFATPLLAGMAASLWSALPDENAMQIRERIIRSADRYYRPDNQYGYGIPDAWKAYTQSPEGTENIPDTSNGQDKCTKILRGEQIYILRHGHVYNLGGQRVQ